MTMGWSALVTVDVQTVEEDTEAAVVAVVATFI